VTAAAGQQGEDELNRKLGCYESQTRKSQSTPHLPGVVTVDAMSMLSNIFSTGDEATEAWDMV
jgi:hypothetical protein